MSLRSPVKCSEHTDSVKWVLLNQAHFSKKKISDVTKWLKLVTVLDVFMFVFFMKHLSGAKTL